MNEATLLTVMLETPQAIENVEAIAAVDGIDVLMIGGTDLSIEMGLAAQYEHPRMVASFDRVIAAARQHGKFVGMGGIFDESIAARYIGMGMRMILSGVDLGLMMAAATQRTTAFRRLLT